MRLKNELFEIEINELDKTEFRNLTTKAEHIIDPRNFAGSDFAKIVLVAVTSQTTSRQIILIGDGYSMIEHSALLEDQMLTVLLNDIIVQINLTDCALVRSQELDWFGCNFELYKIENEYLIYGEAYIVRLNRNLEKVWAFSGSDIFVSITGNRAFELGTDSMRLYDFRDNFYEIDFSGKIIANHIV